MPITAFHSTRTITGDTVKEATVLVQNGKITSVADGLVLHAGVEWIEVGDRVLMAGITDPHVHINEPGRDDWEGFDTATRAAVAGGITSLVEMPLNASPVTTSVAAFNAKLAAATGRLHANCGFWGGIVPGNAPEIKPLAAKGVLGFKAFLTHSGIDEFPDVTEDDLDIAMPIIAQTGLPLLVHCELSDDNPGLPNRDARSYQQYLASRPAYWEDEAIAMMIRLCEKHQCRVHIVHLSSAGSIDQIKRAKEKGLPLTVETAQHYLYFNAEEIADGRTAFKCAPPIRERANNEKIWQALKEGIIDFVATDHSPAPPALKQLESGDFVKAWGGIASLQFALPVLWTAAKKHDVSLETIARWLCAAPPQLAGLHHRKGQVKAGYDADLVVWDPGEAFIVQDEGIHHKHKTTPYKNEKLFGVVKQTYLAGKKVYDSGEFTGLNCGKVLLHQTKTG